jgi:tripartite ATP-independent transporter DctP family solute receptor
LLSLFGCDGCDRARSHGKTVWRFAIEETRGSVQDRYAQLFAERIEDRTDGRIDVKVYPYGTLGTSDQLTEQLHDGTLEFTMASPGHLGKLIPEVQVFLLHFVLSDKEEANKIALRDGEELRSRFNLLYGEKGLHLLSVFSEGWMVWTANKAIRRPEDFEGVKFRVMTSPLLLAAYEAYGASPTPLAYSEVYSGLQLDMIDGQVNPIFAIWEMSFYEVSDYLIFPHHAPFITTVVTGEEFFEGLPREDQRLIEETSRELHDYVFDVQNELNRERLEKIKKEKPSIEVIHLSEEERAAFRKRSLPVREQYVELAGTEGREILDLLLATVKDAEAKIEGTKAEEP